MERPARDAESSVAAVALATVLSRIAGLFRDSVLFALLGLSVWSGAFLFAFTIPNLFRRMLGEGALSSAMIPLFTETLERRSRTDAFAFLNQLLTRLSVLILGAIACFATIFFLLHRTLSAHWLCAIGLSLLLAPYLLFACLSAMISGALNSFGSFGLPALTALFLNGAMLIFGAAALFIYPAGGLPATLFLCAGVLGGGICQLAFSAHLLRLHGWHFRWDCSSNPLLSRLWHLFLPAVLGAAMVQINVTLSRLLAFALTVGGISTLYLSSRLVELPLGIFAIAIISVAFPGLSRLAADGNGDAFAANCGRAHRSMLMVTIPATIGLMLLGRPILTLLFSWGNYGSADLAKTLPVLWASTPGIPFFALVGLSTRIFHAGQDMRSPLSIAAIGIGANLLLTVLLVGPLGAVGIASANVLSSALQCILLQRKMARSRGSSFTFSALTGRTIPLLLASAALLCFLLLSNYFLQTSLPLRLDALVRIAFAIPAGTAVYVLTLRCFRYEEVSLFFALLKPLRRKK
jgi:putative peptidoglycan lipid II flippase